MAEQNAQQRKPRTRRKFSGTVVSDTMEKAVVVRVDRIKTHPRYRKKYAVSKRFHVHDPKNAARVGDTVTFEETRPISKAIRWRLISIAKNE